MQSQKIPKIKNLLCFKGREENRVTLEHSCELCRVLYLKSWEYSMNEVSVGTAGRLGLSSVVRSVSPRPFRLRELQNWVHCYFDGINLNCSSNYKLQEETFDSF